MPLRHRIYDTLEARKLRGLAAWVQGGLMVLIVLNVLAVVLETVAPIEAAYRAEFRAFEIFSVAVFALEYVARLYSSTASPREQFRHPVFGRLRFAFTPMALIDLVAILPIILTALFGHDLGSLRVVRILRAFKLMRYSSSMAMLGRVLYNERKSLAGCVLIFLVVLLLASTVAYFAERHAQPKLFGSIPDAMWWAMAALTTVGYGDVTPATTLGRMVGSVVVLLGIGAIALPTGIIASAFLDESKRRDFTVNWSLLADIPLFRQLMAPRIADLVRMLRPRFVQPNELVIRRGEVGNSLFIIADGEVEVDFGGGRDPVVLGPGQFFGELALLERGVRSATVRAIGECKLLELGGMDFHELMAHHRELRETIERVAAERRAANAVVAG